MDTPHVPTPSEPQSVRDAFAALRKPRAERPKVAPKNANAVHGEGLSALDRLALAITAKVGSVGFFLLILSWTVLWCGYNILASELPALHLRAFDPFPAFVAYLLISNVVQILLMPLIMVGQNLQGRHSETRAELDFEINQKAEREVTVILAHLEHNTDLLIELMRHLDCKVSDEIVRALAKEHELGKAIEEVRQGAGGAA